MRKLAAVILCICTLLALTSCGYSKKKQNKVTAMFDTFNKPDNCILLTNHQLVIGNNHYYLSEITHNNKKCNILLLEEFGFYSYTYDNEDSSVAFLFTEYESFDTAVLGCDTVPADIIHAC